MCSLRPFFPRPPEADDNAEESDESCGLRFCASVQFTADSWSQEWQLLV